MIRGTLLTIGIVVVGIVSMPTQAGEADKEISAEYLVCDSLREDGVTKGLYKLCVQYCRSETRKKLHEKKASAKEVASFWEKAQQKIREYEENALKKREKYAKKVLWRKAKALARYKRKMKDSDPPMPCLNTIPDAELVTDITTTACPCFNARLCEQMMADGDSCDLQSIETLIDLFPQESCDLADSCLNTATSATDVCIQDKSATGVSVRVYEDRGYGECSASVNSVKNAILRLDLTTAQRCLAELNDFDPEVDTIDTRKCNLAD